jgi:hypothetical protein
MNNFQNIESFNDNKHLLSVNTIFVGIEGENHAQFGDDDPQ